MPDKGLKFDPMRGFRYGSLADISWEKPIQEASKPVAERSKPSSPIPTIADKYHDSSSARYPRGASTFLKELSIRNPLKDLDTWDKGVTGLEEDELNEWKSKNSKKIAGKSNEWIDRLWRNQEFVSSFGLEDFYNFDAEARDRMMEERLASRAVQFKYWNESDDNKNIIVNLTPEGKRELLKEYNSNYELKESEEQRKNKSWLDFNLSERSAAVSSNISKYGSEGIWLGSIAGGAIGTPIGGPAGTAIGTIGGMSLGATTGLLYGLAKGILDPASGVDVVDYEERSKNQKILDGIYNRDLKRKEDNTVDLKEKIYQDLVDKYKRGEIDPNEEYDRIALAEKKEVDEDSFGSPYNNVGSNHYKAFKDHDMYNKFNAYEKLAEVAKYKAIEMAYDSNSANRVLDIDAQNYISKNQTGWTWLGHTLSNVFVGGVANLMNSKIALDALAAYSFYGSKGLANFLEGKDAETGEENSWWRNAKYWDKVDKYNTFLPSVIDKAEANGGISTWNNIAMHGDEENFNWYTFNEAIKMSKFAWSDALKIFMLSKAFNGMTRLAGGQYIAPGVLSAESGTAAQVSHWAGVLGTIGASHLGIDAAYGYQTFEEVLGENNRKINEIIGKDVNSRIEEEINSGELENKFRIALKAENERRKKEAEKTGKFIPINEDKAWNDFVRMRREELTKEEEDSHKEDRQQAANDAADAYATDATIEALRMSTTGAAFRSWLFDKGTLNAIRLNSPYVNTVERNGQYFIGKNPVFKRAAATVLAQTWGGFESNYFDDVTVAFARGMQIQDYNNYLLQKYNPAAYGEILDEYVSPMVAAIAGANNALTDRRSFLDGSIGALGSPLSLTVHPVTGTIALQDLNKEARDAAAVAERKGEKYTPPSMIERVSLFVKNPIINAIAEAKSATNVTRNTLEVVNKGLAENKYSFDNIVEVLAAMNRKAVAREGDDILIAEDEKDREAITLAMNFLRMKNNGAVAGARHVEQNAWDRKKRFSTNLANAVKNMFGVPIATSPQNSFQIAMQTLQDASTINELQAYSPGQESGQNSEEENRAIRQSNLIQTFLGIDDNKNATKDLSEEEKIKFARERLKRNSVNLLNVMSSVDKVQQAMSKSITAHENIDLQNQLTYQYVLNDIYKRRFIEMNAAMRGEELEEGADIDELFSSYNQQSDPRAAYGSEKGRSRMLSYLGKQITQNERDIAKNEKILERTNKGIEEASSREEVASLTIRAMGTEFLIRQLKKEKERLDSLVKSIEEDSEKNPLTKDSGVLTADDILNKLSAEDRLRILDPFYREDYGEEQKREIEKAENQLMQKTGLSLEEAMKYVRDTAILSERLKSNMEAAKNIVKNPAEAVSMFRHLLDNRRTKIVEYLNEKVIGEAFAELANSDISESEADVVKYASSKSSTVLRGIAKLANFTVHHPSESISDKKLKNIIDGVDKVLEEKEKRSAKNSKLKAFVRNFQKAKHEEVNAETQEKVTTDREISYNDKRVLQYAIDFASDTGISVEDVVKNEDAFWRYVEEKDHSSDKLDSLMEPEMATSRVDNQYLSSLIDDVIKTHEEHLKEKEKKNAKKKTTGGGKSVPHKTINPKVEGKRKESKENKKGKSEDVIIEAEEETKESKDNKKGSRGGKKETNVSINKGILEDAAEKNNALLTGINKILDFVDGMKMTDEERKTIKDIVRKVVTKESYDNMSKLANAIVLATAAVRDFKIKNIAKRIASNEDIIKSENTGHTIFFSDIKNLFTRSLDYILSNPSKYGGSNSPLISYIKMHNMPQVIQNLADLHRTENEEYSSGRSKNNFVWKNITTAFIYDPELAGEIEGSIQSQGGVYNPDISAPVILVIGLKGDNDILSERDIKLRKAAGGTERVVDGKTVIMNGNWIKIKVSENKKTGKVVYNYFQPIGIMPAGIAGEGASNELKATAQAMNTVRSFINYKREGPQLIRRDGKTNYAPLRPAIESINIDNPNKGEQQEDVKRSSVDLMNDNLQDESQRMVSDISDEDASRYIKAVEKDKEEGGNENQTKIQNVYKALRSAFIKRLFKERVSDARANLMFSFMRSDKGTSATPRTVYTKDVSQTTSTQKGGRALEEVVRTIKEKRDRRENATADINYLRSFNSRIATLVRNISGINVSVLYDTDGNLVGTQEEIKSKQREFNEAFKRAISKVFFIDGLNVETTLLSKENAEEDRPRIKVVIKSGDTELVSLDLNKGRNLLTSNSANDEGIAFSAYHLADFIYGIMFDENGNKRTNLKDREIVKWQVNYEDADLINKKDKSEEEKERSRAALHDYEELYDSGIFVMMTDRMANTPTTVAVSNVVEGINGVAPNRPKSPKRTSKPEGDPVNVANGRTGAVDAKTGALIEKKTKEIIKTIEAIGGKVGTAFTILKTLINRSSQRNLVDDNHYEIDGKRTLRVTSIKHAIRDTIGRFREGNAWGLPSTSIGDSADDFLRDVSNGIFDQALMDGKFSEIEKELDNYENSTSENYMELFKQFKLLQLALLEKGQVIVATGDRDNPGKITVYGDIDVKIKNPDNTSIIKKITVGGTVDLITIDKQGRLHIYDFKTRRDEVLSKKGAIGKGYDIQLNLYARFLERETGLQVASINIIPIEVSYKTPIGKDNDGNPIENGKVKYERKYPDNKERHQLVTANPTNGRKADFKDANFNLHREDLIGWDRNEFLSDEDLSAAYDNFTDEEKQSMLDEVEDQNGGGEAAIEEGSEVEEINAEDGKPEDAEEESEDEKEDLGKASLGHQAEEVSEDDMSFLDDYSQPGSDLSNVEKAEEDKKVNEAKEYCAREKGSK